MSKIQFGTDPSKSLLYIRMYLPVLICCTRMNEGYFFLTEATTNVSQYHELTIPVDSQAIKRTIAEHDTPRAAVLVSIQRRDEIIIPRGDTLLYMGDIITVLCERQYLDEVKGIFTTKEDSSP